MGKVMKIEIGKPVIPQFVADWIEKERTSSPIHKSFPRAVDLVNHDNDWRNWANEVGGSWSRILATAWVKGYGIEQEPLYYAKVKGWELATTTIVFWNYRHIVERPILSKLYVGGKESVDSFKTKMTIEQWNEVGINDTNADFEKVEDLKND